jgi:hypothetical protein
MMQKLTPYRLWLAAGMTIATAGIVATLGWLSANAAIAIVCVLLYIALGAAQGVFLTATHPQKQPPWYFPMFLMLLAALSPVLLGMALGTNPEVWEGWLLRLHHPAILLLARDRIGDGDWGTFDYFFFFTMPVTLVWIGLLIQNKVRKMRR